MVPSHNDLKPENIHGILLFGPPDKSASESEPTPDFQKFHRRLCRGQVNLRDKAMRTA
jgi:hypothetical protein